MWRERGGWVLEGEGGRCVMEIAEEEAEKKKKKAEEEEEEEGEGRGWRTEETKDPLRYLADQHSPHSDTSSTNYSRRYSSSHHAPKLINPAKDAPHPYGAQSRSHPCTSSYQARRNACARGVEGGTRGGRRYNREVGGNITPA
jgi:hypothetical protein